MKSLQKIVVALLLITVCTFYSIENHIAGIATAAMPKGRLSDTTVGPVPPSFGFDTFYKKYINANGVSVVSSANVSDEALVQARKIIILMLEKLPEVKAELLTHRVHVAIIGSGELPTMIPEHRDLNTAFPETNWDTRGRGYGATLKRPVTTCGEENLLCYEIDRYRGENILVHEFAHTIHELGLRYVYRDFDKKLEDAYNSAKSKGLWQKTYAITSAPEYWAEGVQDWFNVNLSSIPANGIHNEIHTRAQLKEYDPGLYALINTYFFDSDQKIGCTQK